MKKFSFQLEPVLKYKGDILELLKNEHSKALKKVVDQEELISQLESEKNKYINEFNIKKQGFISIVEAGIYENYIIKQNAIIKYEYNKLKELENEENRKREKMIEAKKEKLSIEKLKEIQVYNYNKSVQKENELFIEEFVSNSRLRK